MYVLVLVSQDQIYVANCFGRQDVALHVQILVSFFSVFGDGALTVFQCRLPW